MGIADNGNDLDTHGTTSFDIVKDPREDAGAKRVFFETQPQILL
jgi:hypothetical protein